MGMIRRRPSGAYYCDGRGCGYPLTWFDAAPLEGDPPLVVCPDCNASMWAEKPAAVAMAEAR